MADTSTLLPVPSGVWDYSIDSFNDSVAVNEVGNTVYEIFGIAVKEEGDRLIFAVNTNLPLSGILAEDVADDNWIAWGDLILNFTGVSLDAAKAGSQNGLYAIRFYDSDDPLVGSIPVWT